MYTSPRFGQLYFSSSFPRSGQLHIAVLYSHGQASPYLVQGSTHSHGQTSPYSAAYLPTVRPALSRERRVSTNTWQLYVHRSLAMDILGSCVHAPSPYMHHPRTTRCVCVCASALAPALSRQVCALALSHARAGLSTRGGLLRAVSVGAICSGGVGASCVVIVLPF